MERSRRAGPELHLTLRIATLLLCTATPAAMAAEQAVWSHDTKG